VIDLRSDTLSKPPAELLAAMAAAEVGDEQYREDPTTNELQRRMAELLGHESALFVPTATMANQIALRAQTTPGATLVAEDAAVWEAIEARMQELFPYALGVVTETFDRYEDGITPFGLEMSTFTEFATSQFGKRYDRISRARGKTLGEIDAIAEEDAA